MAKAQYSKPTSQVDLEARQKSDYVPSTVLNQGSDPELSENGYVGVDPIYQNAANVTEQPIEASGGAEAKVFDQYLSETAEYPELPEDEDDDAEDGSESQTPPAGAPSL